ncbi:MAG TPA: CBS domain-containing protein [Saprospiraceae bacterium]|nr:CBS domain-containing protein [Saprospiraceae bacterium]
MPEVMEAIILKGGVIRPRVVVAKIIASAVSIGTGGSVGREGPIVQIGSAAGSVLGQAIRVNGSQLRTMVACGAAAGIAGTFNAPIAGSIFALEILLGDFAITQFSPIVIASVTSTVISRHYLGNYPAFTIPSYELVSVWEFIPYSILGVLAAFVAVLFIDVVYKAEDVFEAIPIPEWVKPAIGGLIIGAIGIFFPQIFGVGYETMDMTLASKLSWSFLLMLIFLKLMATSITIGSGGSGGIFAPSLFLGGALGGAVGTVANMVMPDLVGSAGAYALVGMATVSAATMHAPITSILILFELTNDYRIILPLMTAVIISTVLKMNLKKESMYSLKLIRKGLDIQQDGEPNVLSKIKVKKIINQGCLTVLADTPFSELHELTKESINLNYFVVDENKKLLGILSPHKIRTIENRSDIANITLTAKDLIVEKGIFFTPEDTLDKVVLILNDIVLDEIPIVNNDIDQIVIGYISKTEVINAYNREMAKTDMLNSVAAYIGSAGKFRQLKMIDGEVLCEVEVPGKYIGKNLSELDLRHKYGIEVILIKQNYDEETNESEKVFVPNPEYRFAHGDKLLIVGSQEEVDLFNG